MKHKELILEACQTIKSRRRNKLGDAGGICGAIYNIVPPRVHFTNIQEVVTKVVEDNNLGLGDGFIDRPYEWTPKRRRLLDKLIEYLSKE